MTPQEIAEEIVTVSVPEYIVAVDRKLLKERIRVGIVNAASEELEKRRRLEASLGQTCAPIIGYDDKHTVLRVWNPIRKEFAVFYGVHEGPGL